jgi:membrane-anchored protein YejM (alkaline phosphatase superfamily)
LSFVLPKEKPLRFISAIIATLALVLLLIDTRCSSCSSSTLNGQVWQLLLDQAQTEEGSIWSIIFVAVPTIFLLQLLLSAYVWRKINKRKRRQYGNQVGLALLVCFILTHVVNSWADATLYQPITMQRANFPLSYPMTAKSFLAKHGWLDLDQYEKKAESQDGDNASRCATAASAQRQRPADPQEPADRGGRLPAGRHAQQHQHAQSAALCGSAPQLCQPHEWRQR